MPDSGGQGEPLNVVILASSDAAVLVDQQNDGGLINYFQCARFFASFHCAYRGSYLRRRSIGFANECLGQHEGSHQQANLGDGNGYRACTIMLFSAMKLTVEPVNETAVIRWDYGDAVLGTCKESIEGGNHFRYWVQNGDKANTCVPSLTCFGISHGCYN